MTFWAWLLVAAAAAGPDSLTAAGRQLAPLHPGAALEYFRRALALDSLAPEPNWRAAVALVDLGEAASDSAPSPARDSAYAEALRLAGRAVAADSLSPDAHFALALALGRTALAASAKARVRYGVAVAREAGRVLALAPEHDGAHHILGVWHAEIMRLSGLSRFVARRFLGGKIFSQASWDSAFAHLETAVRIDSTRIIHRLDLGKLAAERGRFDLARREWTAILALPDRVALDPRYRAEAGRLLAGLAGRRGA